MSTFAISMVRDEADIIEACIRRMARHVDQLIVADNGSADGTRNILDRLARELPLEVTDDLELGYFQSRKMTALAQRAAAGGADWVIPFDADEVWLPRPGGRIKDVLGGLDPAVLIAEAALFDHVATARDDATVDPMRRMGWRRAAQAPLRKVAARARPGLTIHQGNHSASFAGVRHAPTVTDALEVRHFPYRSPEQMVRKAVNGRQAYQATDLPEHAGKHWRDYGAIVESGGPEALHTVFREWFWSADPVADGLVHDPTP